VEQPDGTLRRSGSTPDGDAGSPRRGAVVRALPWVVPILAGVLVAAVAWALQDDRASLVIGLVSGASFGLGLLLFLVLGVLLVPPAEAVGAPSAVEWGWRRRAGRAAPDHRLEGPDVSDQMEGDPN
jgi:hypothetical protein